MKYRFYATSEKAWESMIEAISNAQKSIYLEMYIFADNTEGYNFFDVLKQKSQQGVKVKLIIDSFGSNNIGKQAIRELREVGIEVLFFSYWLQRTHKKILVIDEKIAFIGGVNIHKLFRKWNDLQARLEGPIVRSVIRSFARSYKSCGGKDSDILSWENKKNALKKTRLWILEHWKFNSKRMIKRHYKERIGYAKNGVILVTPYFAPRRWLIGELHQAVLRGVDVEILLPARTDLWFVDRVSNFYIHKLHKLGIRFYLEKEMNHAKAMLIDNQEGVIGSHNIDSLSFEYDVEAGIFFTKQDMINDLRSIITDWKNNATLFEPALYRPMWIDYVLSPVIKIFQSII